MSGLARRDRHRQVKLLFHLREGDYRATKRWLTDPSKALTLGRSRRAAKKGADDAGSAAARRRTRWSSALSSRCSPAT